MHNPSIQTTILRNLITDEIYTRKVIPFLQKNYFEGIHRAIFEQVVLFVTKYNKMPTTESLTIDLQDSDITEKQYDDANIVLNEISKPEKVDQVWLLDQTEKWCQDRAIYIAIMESITIIDGQHKELSKNALPDLLQDALAVSFDTNVGHDYIENAEERYEFYHKVDEKIPFDLDYFNRITKNGKPNKSLIVVLASTGVGKSLFMCHDAAATLSMGKNVLYITMEMAEEKIAERIDANLFNVALDQIEKMPKDLFMSKVNGVSSKNNGRLIVKEYPTGSAHVGHFRALLNELKLKKKFVPDIIYIDYLNICSSSRIKGLGGSVNTYSLVKSIAEEIRGLAVENNVPIMTATQSNRSGFQNSDMDLDNTSESWGLPATADLMFALISTEELEKLNQLMIKQLKNRYSDVSSMKRFLIGIDRSKMKLYDLEESAQTLLSTEKPDQAESGGGGYASKPKRDYTDFKM